MTVAPPRTVACPGQQNAPARSRWPPRLLEQARAPRQAHRRPRCRGGSQGRALLRVDGNARPRGAAAGEARRPLRPARRLGAAEEAASAGARVQHDARCAFFISTNAGSTGLNLQAANTIVNVVLCPGSLRCSSSASPARTYYGPDAERRASLRAVAVDDHHRGVPARQNHPTHQRLALTATTPRGRATPRRSGGWSSPGPPPSRRRARASPRASARRVGSSSRSGSRYTAEPRLERSAGSLLETPRRRSCRPPATAPPSATPTIHASEGRSGNPTGSEWICT